MSYFKYANFFVDSVATMLGQPLQLLDIVLPLGISFFTFTQIAYLVDAWRGEVDSFSFSRYFLFVTWFPHLIAGPVLHHREMMPQFANPAITAAQAENFSVGISIFAIGLFKKIVLADSVASYANVIFNGAASGEAPTLLFAWGGALAYSCQLYFDFSGYSDMAIGLSRTFGIRLPVNFNSPYKATSISDFWRRWHMTLSRFLRDYLYISLGGNRRGAMRRYVNLFVTMVLGGLWHGAAWTFVFWGALHGLYLVINHAWRHAIDAFRLEGLRRLKAYRVFSWAVTFLAVVVGWVFFRAESFDAATRILNGMVGLNGVSLPAAVIGAAGTAGDVLVQMGVKAELGRGREFIMTFAWVVPLLAIAFLMPNGQEILCRYGPALEETSSNTVPRHFQWQPSLRWAVAVAVAGGLGLISLSRHSEFLYWQF